MNVDQQPTFLKIESNKTASLIGIPKFLKVLKDVSSDKNYERNLIARQEWKMPEQDKKDMKVAQIQLQQELQASGQKIEVPPKLVKVLSV